MPDKEITAFSSDDRHLSLDLAGYTNSFHVDKKTKVLVFAEGFGDDRFPTGFLPGDLVESIEYATSTLGSISIYICYLVGNTIRKHKLGESAYSDDAQFWMHELGALLDVTVCDINESEPVVSSTVGVKQSTKEPVFRFPLETIKPVEQQQVTGESKGKPR